MSGAVVVPDLSANPVAIKALKQFTAVNGFTKSVIECDGHSGLLRLQEQVGREVSLPTQVSSPYGHQSRETWSGQVRAIRIGSADHLGIRSDQVDRLLLPWIVQHAACQINRYLITEPRTRSSSMSLNKITHCSFRRARPCSHSVSTTGTRIADTSPQHHSFFVRQGCRHRHSQHQPQ